MIRIVYLAFLLLILPLSCRESSHQQPGGGLDPDPVKPLALIENDDVLIPNEESRDAASKRVSDYFNRRARYNGFNGTVLLQ